MLALFARGRYAVEKEITMARDWFGRKSDTGISGIDGYYDQPGGWRLWVRRIVGIFVILALLAAFIWAATWVYDSVTNDNVENGEESGQVTTPDDGSIDNGAPTDGEGTTTDGTDSTNGSTSTDSTGTTDGDTADSSDSSSTTGTGSTGSENDSMPQTGDDSGDVPPTDVLPATGG